MSSFAAVHEYRATCMVLRDAFLSRAARHEARLEQLPKLRALIADARRLRTETAEVAYVRRGPVRRVARPEYRDVELSVPPEDEAFVGEGRYERPMNAEESAVERARCRSVNETTQWLDWITLRPTVADFDRVLRSLYDGELIRRRADSTSAWTAMAKALREPGMMYVSPVQYERLQRSAVQLGTLPVTVVADPSVPRDRAYVIPFTPTQHELFQYSQRVQATLQEEIRRRPAILNYPRTFDLGSEVE